MLLFLRLKHIMENSGQVYDTNCLFFALYELETTKWRPNLWLQNIIGGRLFLSQNGLVGLWRELPRVAYEKFCT